MIMADFSWNGLGFSVIDGIACLTEFGGCASPRGCVLPAISQIQIEGEHKNSHCGNKVTRSSEERRLKYVSHEASDGVLTVLSRSELIETEVIYEYLGGAYAVRAKVTNISDGETVLEYVSSLYLAGIGGSDPDENRIFLYTFPQGHHRECQPRRLSLYDLGIYTKGNPGQNRITVGNVGGWSSKEYLPQLIIEDERNGAFFMCQIESNNSWYSEISDDDGRIYLYTGGARECFGSWNKKLKPGESFGTVRTAFAFSDSLDGVVGKMTEYRRAVAGYSRDDRGLPVIYNEYMHFSWDSPTEENTRAAAPVAASCGVKYYVIDCGWHNEEPGSEVYPYVGQWIESKARFPHGVKQTLEYIKSLGMKPGLWIEPEIIGDRCSDMLSYYGDGDFLTRGGKRIHVMGRYFLDFRSPRVRGYLTETIRRMTEDYGAEYIKFDYNEELGVGCDGGDSPGSGLEDAARAFLDWVDSVRKLHPGVVFEACASGGMRMDGQTLRHFSLVSTSDQIDYLKYPYIAGNILSAAIPEQAAVWSYPVAAGRKNEDISRECVVINMVNALLGRIHLASRLAELDESKLALVKEGVEYYKSLTEAKKKALPVFPFGFTKFGEKHVSAGFKSGGKLYLAVWKLGSDETLTPALPAGYDFADARIAYPKDSRAELIKDAAGSLDVRFSGREDAVFLEIDLR